MTGYVVLQENQTGSGNTVYHEVGSIEATNAGTARRIIAEKMDADLLDGGVTLIAIPARNWKTGRGILKAETQRKIRSA